MVYFAEEDIDVMLADWPNSITIGAVTKKCLVDERDEVVQEQPGQAGQIVRVIVATIKTSDYPTVQGGAACVVDGVNYTVWQRLRVGDGALTELYLRNA